MVLKYIPNWQDKKHKCFFCGTDKSVKYIVSMKGAYVCACNKCALFFPTKLNREEDEGK